MPILIKQLAAAQDTREEKVIEDAFSYFRDTFGSETRDEWFEILSHFGYSQESIQGLRSKDTIA